MNPPTYQMLILKDYFHKKDHNIIRELLPEECESFSMKVEIGHAKGLQMDINVRINKI